MWKYIGDGSFYSHIPARDLSEEEVQSLGVLDVLGVSELYEHVLDRVDRVPVVVPETASRKPKEE